MNGMKRLSGLVEVNILYKPSRTSSFPLVYAGSRNVGFINKSEEGFQLILKRGAPSPAFPTLDDLKAHIEKDSEKYSQLAKSYSNYGLR